MWLFKNKNINKLLTKKIKKIKIWKNEGEEENIVKNLFIELIMNSDWLEP
jgi:hypothetical protein